MKRGFMAISIQIESETGMAIATCSGVLQIEDAKKGAATLWKSPDWKGVSVVWDFREAQFDVTTSNVRRIAEFVLRRQPAIPPAKVAFVTQRDVDFGMARMFEVFREDPRTAFRVFRDFDEAVSWARTTGTDAT